MTTQWDKNQEIDFFTRSLGLAAPEQLFYLTNTGSILLTGPRDMKRIKILYKGVGKMG
jgi:hypothetical protein